MNPAMIIAIASLLNEMLLAGTTLASIIETARATGQIAPEVWDEIMADFEHHKTWLDEEAALRRQGVRNTGSVR